MIVSCLILGPFFFLQPIVDEDSEEEEEVTTTTEEHTQPVPLSTDSSELNSTDSNSLSGKTP